MNLGGTIRLNKLGVVILVTLLCVFIFYMFITNNQWKALSNKDQVNLRQLLAIAIKAAQNGGDEILNVKDLKVESKGKTNEGVNDPVTTADFNSHCVMKGTLAKYFPDLLVVSEEAKAVCMKNLDINTEEPKNVFLKDLQSSYVDPKDIIIWIDPLDATKEYTEHLYKYVTTMVCVVVKGIPLIGVIHKPYEEATYWAWVDQKAHNYKKPLNSQDEDRTIVISMSHSGDIKTKLSGHFKKGYKVIEAAGSGYKVLEVIFGRASAYVHGTAIKKWDICAGNALLNAIDGKMTDKFNKLITYTDVKNPVNLDGVVATVNNHELYIGSF